jgi:hypothetical protein
MAQALIVYAIVAIAAVWTTWRLFLRGWVKRRVAAQAAGKSASACGNDCACGD